MEIECDVGYTWFVVSNDMSKICVADDFLFPGLIRQADRRHVTISFDLTLKVLTERRLVLILVCEEYKEL